MEIVTKVRLTTEESRVFDMIHETTSRSVWNTGKAKRGRVEFMQKWKITEEELKKMISTAHYHATHKHGGHMIEMETLQYLKFKALADFCYTL